jgi:hypothetical protein
MAVDRMVADVPAEADASLLETLGSDPSAQKPQGNSQEQLRGPSEQGGQSYTSCSLPSLISVQLEASVAAALEASTSSGKSR